MRLSESALALASRCSAEILAGRYRLDARIGSGGAADVYRGFDLRLRRAVAVKVFRPGTGVESEEGFGSEAVILARLQHPGLVTAYDAGRHDGRAFLVMQLIEGCTLKARIAEGTLSCEDTAALGAGLAQALAHAHEAGVVHRDVKPSNILLDTSGRPYLTDFGISRLVDATTRTVAGTLVGTAAYLAPEQVLGQSVGRPADVYALGLVLLECLTGRLEYSGGPLEAAIARLHRPPEVPSTLPNELLVLLRDMTALDEQNRPSALDCARELTPLADTILSAPAAPTTPAPAANRTAFAASREPAHDDDATHLHALPTPDRAVPKAAPARSRVLVASGTVALATVMAAALAVTDGLPHRGSDGNTARVVSRPTQNAGSEGSSADGNDASATPEDPPTSTHDTSDGLHRDAPSARNARPTSGSALANSASGAGTLPDLTSASGVQAGTKAVTPNKKSSKPEKAEKVESEKEKQKKPGKTD
ncbi:serine/threonine-protein kinase [Streptomyces sp. NBC_00199]|uniref:serine/threonine-protein kinase n=1 Tax=Streptomyces sp. NBC_00199 TaxID=2975678 RepID=UPI002255E4FF|nr:serine/threonine-protein kinase [Streptomyces sp. NBC_00199]MCX5264993.1 serine/threonine protein kinase [Streptomyces sp. NBC_00199]